MSTALARLKYDPDKQKWNPDPDAGLVLIPQVQGPKPPTKQQLKKLQSSEDFGISELLKTSGTSLGYAAGWGTGGVALHSLALSASGFWPFMTLFLASIVCGGIGVSNAASGTCYGVMAALQARTKRTDVEGINAYYMTHGQLEVLKKQMSDEEWNRLEQELAERPMEALGMQLHAELSDYISNTAHVQLELESLKAKAKGIPKWKLRLRPQRKALSSARNSAAGTTVGNIRAAFTAHDDGVIEAAQVSVEAVLETRAITA